LDGGRRGFFHTHPFWVQVWWLDWYQGLTSRMSLSPGICGASMDNRFQLSHPKLGIKFRIIQRQWKGRDFPLVYEGLGFPSDSSPLCGGQGNIVVPKGDGPSKGLHISLHRCQHPTHSRQVYIARKIRQNLLFPCWIHRIIVEVGRKMPA
jgi:hypothetical protein